MACLRLVITVISFSVAAGFAIVPQLQTNEYDCFICQGKVYCNQTLEETCLDMIPCSSHQQQLCMTLNEEECDDVGVFEDPYISTRYYRCVVNEVDGTIRKVFEYCPIGRQFIPWMMRCMDMEEIGIMETMWQNQLQRGPYICKKPGTFSNYKTCKTYYTCTLADSPAEMHSCPWGSFYNDQEGKCTQYLSIYCAEKFMRKYIFLSLIAEARDWDLNQYILNIQNYYTDYDDSYSSYDDGFGEFSNDYYDLNDYVLGGMGRRREDSGLKMRKLKRVFFGIDTKDTLYDVLETKTDDDLLSNYLSSLIDLVPHEIRHRLPLDRQKTLAKGSEKNKPLSSGSIEPSNSGTIIKTSTNIGINKKSTTILSSATANKNPSTSIEHTDGNYSSTENYKSSNSDSYYSKDWNASSIWTSPVPSETKVTVKPIESLLFIPDKSQGAKPSQIIYSNDRPNRPIQPFGSSHDPSLPSMNQVLDNITPMANTAQNKEEAFASQNVFNFPYREEYKEEKVHINKDTTLNWNPVVISEAIPNKNVYYDNHDSNSNSKPTAESDKNSEKPIVDVSRDHIKEPISAVLGNLNPNKGANPNSERNTIKIVETNIYPSNDSIKIVKTSVNPVNNAVKIVETNVSGNNAKICMREYPCSKVSSSDMKRTQNFYCTEPGNFRDPFNCHKYFLCVEDHNPYDDVDFRIKHMTCGVAYFNEEKQICDDEKPEGCLL